MTRDEFTRYPSLITCHWIIIAATQVKSQAKKREAKHKGWMLDTGHWRLDLWFLTEK
jgi:hypothetical protein